MATTACFWHQYLYRTSPAYKAAMDKHKERTVSIPVYLLFFCYPAILAIRQVIDSALRQYVCEKRHFLLRYYWRPRTSALGVYGYLTFFGNVQYFINSAVEAEAYRACPFGNCSCEPDLRYIIFFVIFKRS